MILTKGNVKEWKAKIDNYFRLSDDPRIEFYSIAFTDQEWLDSYEGVESFVAYKQILKDYNEWAR